jgi:hypothetical protein
MYWRGICLLPAAKQQIPRAKMPRFGMTIVLGFSNYTTTHLCDKRGSCRLVKTAAIQQSSLGRAVPIVYPVGDAQDAFKAVLGWQDDAGQLPNELHAMVDSVQLLYEPRILNVPDQGHGAYS